MLKNTTKQDKSLKNRTSRTNPTKTGRPAKNRTLGSSENPSGLINLRLVRLQLAGASQRDRRNRLTGRRLRVTQFGGRVQEERVQGQLHHLC